MLAGAVAAWSSFLYWGSLYGGTAFLSLTGVELGYGVPTLFAGIGLIVVGLILAVDGPVRRLDWVAVLLSMTIVIVVAVTLILVPLQVVPTMEPGDAGFRFNSGFALVGLSGTIALVCSLGLASASPFTRRQVERYLGGSPLRRAEPDRVRPE